MIDVNKAKKRENIIIKGMLIRDQKIIYRLRRRKNEYIKVGSDRREGQSDAYKQYLYYAKSIIPITRENHKGLCIFSTSKNYSLTYRKKNNDNEKEIDGGG